MNLCVSFPRSRQAEVRGYPSLKAYYKGAELQTHQGPRDLQSLKKFTARAPPSSFCPSPSRLSSSVI